jgi:cobalamin biosynthesis Mg chelatase CobN
MRKLTTYLSVVIAALGIALPAVQASAVTGSGQAHLSLSTASSYAIGSTAYVTVKENSSVAIAGVEADFSYNASQLQYLGTDTSTSSFNTYQPSTGGNGSVTIARTQQGGTYPNGVAIIGVVSFKVLAGSGTTSFTILGSSDIDDSVSAASVCDTSCAGGNVAASFQMTTPVATTPTPPTTGGSSSTSTGSSTSGSAKTTTPTSTGKTSTSTPATPVATTTNNSSSNNKSSQNTKHNATTPKAKHITSHHAGIVTSTFALVVVAAGVYWLVIRKRTEVAPVKQLTSLTTQAKAKQRAKKQ